MSAVRAVKRPREEELVAEPPRVGAPPRECPYLDTVDRARLDFDAPHVCSVSMSNTQVYACLVCGGFFRGKGPRTEAHSHSLDEAHHVFMRLSDGRVWCLPGEWTRLVCVCARVLTGRVFADGYEVLDASLSDIQSALHPSFGEAQVRALGTVAKLSTDVNGEKFLPGFLGIENLGCSDYLSVVVQLLSQVEMVRSHFLRRELYAGNTSKLVNSFGSLLRRMWNPFSLRSTVSPHEFAAVVAEASGKRFMVSSREEAVQFMQWLLQQLHHDLLFAYPGDVRAALEGRVAEARSAGGDTKALAKELRAARGGNWRAAGGYGPGRSVVTEAFGGEVRVRTLRGAKATRATAEQAQAVGADLLDPDGASTVADDVLWAAAEEGTLAGAEIEEQTLPTLMLSLDLPPIPLFQDSDGAKIIPQVPLSACLSKFNGLQSTPGTLNGRSVRRRYKVLRLPRYLTLVPRRFYRAGFTVEKNPTIITFPFKGLDMTPYVQPTAFPRHPLAGPRLSSAIRSLCRDAPDSNDLLPPDEATAERLSDPVAVAHLCALARVDTGDKSLAWRKLCSRKYHLVGVAVHDSSGVRVATSAADDAQAAAVSLSASRRRRRAAAAAEAALGGRGVEGKLGVASGKLGVDAENVARKMLDISKEGTYRASVLCEPTGQWFQMDDLVVQDILPQSLAVSEAYLLLYAVTTS
jgi:U4/U6.U5 tri-snRNP-associated protein 2